MNPQQTKIMGETNNPDITIEATGNTQPKIGRGDQTLSMDRGTYTQSHKSSKENAHTQPRIGKRRLNQSLHARVKTK